jgi:hypothetical protein
VRSPSRISYQFIRLVTQQRRAEHLPEKGDREREDDEEDGVFHRTIGLLVDVDWLDQADAEGGVAGARHLVVARVDARPLPGIRPAEVLHAPLRGEAVAGSRPHVVSSP